MSVNGQLVQAIGLREVVVPSTSLVEGAANTFTQVTTNLSNYFSKAELEKGITLVEAEYSVGQLGAANAANTVTRSMIQVTKLSKTALCDISDSDLLSFHLTFGCSGAAAGCLNFQEARVWPRGPIVKPRQYVVDKNSPYIYSAIASTNQAAALSGSVRLVFAFYLK